MWHSSPKTIIKSEESRIKLLKWFHKHVKEGDPKECWHYNGLERDYYPRVDIGEGSHTAHRAVYEIFYGPTPKDKPYVLHSCDKKSCLNPNHLRCGTMRDNAIDQRFTRDRLIISERDVKVVKFMRSLNYTYREIEDKFNCSIGKIRDTCLGINTHGYVPEDYHFIDWTQI